MIDGGGPVTVVNDDELQLEPEESRWPGLEAGAGDVRLGGRFAQRLLGAFLPGFAHRPVLSTVVPYILAASSTQVDPRYTTASLRMSSIAVTSRSTSASEL